MWLENYCNRRTKFWIFIILCFEPSSRLAGRPHPRTHHPRTRRPRGLARRRVRRARLVRELLGGGAQEMWMLTDTQLRKQLEQIAVSGNQLAGNANKFVENLRRNKGYGTKAHREGIEKHGITPHHRRSFGHSPRRFAK